MTKVLVYVVNVNILPGMFFCKESEDECTCGLCVQYLNNINDYYHYCYYLDRSRFDCRTLLLAINDLEYVYISHKVYHFTALAKIVNFISPEGSVGDGPLAPNDIPYAYAVDELNNIYLFTIFDDNDYVDDFVPAFKIMVIIMNMTILHTHDEVYHKSPYYYFNRVHDYNKLDTTKFQPIFATVIKF